MYFHIQFPCWEGFNLVFHLKRNKKIAVIYSKNMKSERILQPEKIHFQSHTQPGDFSYKFTASV